MSEDGSALPPHGLGSVHSRMRLFGFSIPAVFIACSRRSQSVLKPTSSSVVSAHHGSIWDSWPIAFSGDARGPRVLYETGCPKHAVPNLSAETRPRTRVFQETDSP